MLGRGTPGPISFSNSPDCVIILYLECSIEMTLLTNSATTECLEIVDSEL